MTAVTSRRTIALVGTGLVLVAIGVVTFLLGHLELNEHRTAGPPGMDYETWHSATVAQRGAGLAVALAGVVAIVVAFATRLPSAAPAKPAGSETVRWTGWTRSRMVGSVVLYCVTLPSGWVIGSLGLLVGGRTEGLPRSATAEIFGGVIFVAGVILFVSAPAVVAYMRRTRLALAAAGAAALAGAVYVGWVLSRWPPLLEPPFRF